MTEEEFAAVLAEIGSSPEGPSVGVFFDLDGTLIAGYSAQHLATQRMKDRDINAGEMLRTIGVMLEGGGMNQDTMAKMLGVAAAEWKGRSLEDVDTMAERLFRKTRDKIYPEMREIVAAHQTRGHTVVVASSATSFQVEKIAELLGIEHVLCNRFLDDGEALTGEIATPALWGSGKSDAVQIFATERGLDLADCYFYADGDEDTGLMYLVGKPRPTNPAEEMAAAAKKRGWPIARFSSRGEGSVLKSAGAIASLVPITGAAIGIGLLKRDKRAATNFISENWMKAMFTINGVDINVVGEENAWEQRPAVFIFNHRNGFDPFIATKIIRKDFTGVAKGELRKDPIVGTFGRFIDIAFVDRGDTTQSIESLKEIEEMARKGLSVIIAPEGQRLDTNEVGEFKKGAFRIAMAAGVPIVPIVIRNADVLGGQNATTMNPGSVDVIVLPPIDTAEWTLDDLNANIAGVRQQFIDTLADWPTLDE